MLTQFSLHCITGPPTVSSASNSPVDGSGVVFDIGQAVGIDQSISGDVQIQCPLPMNADPEFASVRWSKLETPVSLSVVQCSLSLDLILIQLEITSAPFCLVLEESVE